MRLAFLVLLVAFAFGCQEPCPPEPGCGLQGDVDNDGVVGGTDLILVKQNWGNTCEGS